MKKLKKLKKINPLASKQMANKQIFWILFSVVIAVLPHLPRLPIWFPVLLILVVTSSWLATTKKIKPLPSLLVAFITIFAFIAIIYFQGFSLNREISVTILTTMTVLKLLETKSKRDAWMVVTLCYFVILTRFFYSQDMLLVFYLLLSVMVITHTLFVLQHNNSKLYFNKREIKQTLGLLLAAVPLAVLFFLFFPRLGSPIWGSPDLFGQGKTGMSDEMSPGSISQLFNDDSTAFRVTFKTAIPAKSQLYWRGPVLWDFDGTTWTRNHDLKPSIRHDNFTQAGEISHYEIELEPTGQEYLFALDYIYQPPQDSFLMSDSQLLSTHKLNQLSHYQVVSILKQYNPYEGLSEPTLNRLLRLPKGFNPETLELVKSWKGNNLASEQIIQKALNWFATDEFYYSYSPPLLYGDTVDQFLFETKSGFCEHYASAFTVMMRAAGIPARVVTGYQGGIKNEGYLLVKQSDAHAWSEVWIKNKGWLRVDPTAAVSPARVEQGSQALMSQTARNWMDTSWYRKLGEKYDGVRHNWNKWVREYNAVKQQALFKVFGFDSKQGKSVAIILGAIMIVTTLLVFLFLYISRPTRKLSEYDKVYKKLVSIFVKNGLGKPESRGVVAYTSLASNKFPQASETIHEFTDLYLKLRFSKYHHKKVTLDKRLSKLVNVIANNI